VFNDIRVSQGALRMNPPDYVIAGFISKTYAQGDEHQEDNNKAGRTSLRTQTAPCPSPGPPL
jgi:hypothetical protein